MDWLTQHLDPAEDVHLRSLTNDWTILLLAGPDARDVLSKAARGDWSAAAFPWLSVRRARIGIADAVVMAVSYSGENAYEIHVPNAQLFAAYTALRAAGDVRLFGARAVESMRMEKGYLHWKADILTEFDPFETGLDRFVNLQKGDFVGRDALAHKTPKAKLSVLHVASDTHAAHGGASVMQGDKVVGTVTSRAKGHRTGLNIAYAVLSPHLAVQGTRLHIDICGTLTPAVVAPTCAFDPQGRRVRG